MLLKDAAIAILLLALFIQNTDGFYRVIIDEHAYENSINNVDIRTTRDFGSGSNFSIECCYFGNCSCSSLYNALTNLTSNVLINITTDVVLSSIIPLVDLASITITGHNNPTVNCNNSGGLHFISCNNCTIEGTTWDGCGARNISDDGNVLNSPVLQFFNSSNITIKNCSFQHSIGQAVALSEMIGDVNIDLCNFLSNKQYEGHGTAIHYSSTELSNCLRLNFMIIANCSFTDNENAKSVVYFGHLSTKRCEYLCLMDSIFQHNKGTPIYLTNQNLLLHGHIDFIENFAENGGGIYSDYSNVALQKSARVHFKRNTAKNNGGAIYLTNHSNILFKDHPVLQNYHCNQPHHTVSIEMTLKFYRNTASVFGQHLYAHNSSITVGDSANVTFSGHHATSSAVYTENYSVMTFEGNSTVTFNNNQAYKVSGGAIYITHSIVTFKGNSTVHFVSNKGTYGNGGAMSIDTYSKVTLKENSVVTFFKNSAGHSSGGALYIEDHSAVSFEGNCTVRFISNSASFNYGGAVYIENYCSVKFTGNALVTFDSNHADKGGAFYISTFSTVTFEGNSAVNFTKNYGSDGGAMYIDYYNNLTFTGNSKVMFKANNAIKDNGGALYVDYSTVVFKGNSLAVFYDNNAFTNGGVVYIYYGLNIMFEENCTVQINSNTATNNHGGGVYISKRAIITFTGYSKVTFYNNTAENDGGAVYIDNLSTLKFNQYSVTIFDNNIADFGGSVFAKSSKMTITQNSFIEFTDNAALKDGGAIYLSDHSNFTQFDNSSIWFYSNTAGDYGRAIYASFKKSLINFNSSDIHFKDNNTGGPTQKPVYINVPKSCNTDCLFHNVMIINTTLPITTSPNKLILYHPAKCIINNDDTDCGTYYMNNIMLGQEITFDACLLDYYDQPTEATQFLVTGMNHQDYNISGSKYTLISCNRTTPGVSVIGNLGPNNSYNYSMTISLYAARTSEFKIISINLTVELSKCHQYPGFFYSSESLKCECYDTENIISCSGSNSTIKRGYWFGNVTGKSTVTHCPNDYCNFTCCEITNGIYHLSPVRANQCRPHRSGTACSDCEKGYTLSFDSPECVEINKCTTDTILVITLSLLYWIVVVVAVFAMMYFKVTIGPLYAIVYYYSVVDILLSRVLFISNGLYTTVSIMSSLAKLTPQFLGQLCLVRNMSGIDQQFIHYIHPLVILLILIMISMLARRSRRVSSFISRGIIPFLCFLLLLSYTSVATTSLLLMRPLSFVDIDKIYTYLSPDIEYFHGRHLVYVIAAIVFTIVIVIGFTLLLLLEPFLNSRINFIKIKPLLDQFQGCYKDKYRCFAGYYMICRLVIILLVMVKISDDFTTQYLLISSCALMQLIHVLVKPYVSTIHNIFDGIILQLIVIISVLPIVEFADNYDETFVLVIIYILIILPLISFIIIKFWINKKNILNFIKRNILNATKCSHKYNTIPTDDGEKQVECTVVDDDSRKRTSSTEVVV